MVPCTDRRVRPSSGTRFAPLAFALVALSCAIPANAQVAPSPLGRVTQDVSGTEISIEHYRPSVRGRLIDGGLVPHGEFWTPSANYTTKIRFSKDVTFGGTEVPAGAYGLWIEGAESAEWRAMLIADTTKGHGPHLSQEDGLFVVPALHDAVDAWQETLLLQIDSVRATGALLRMNWGNDRVTVPIGVALDVVLTVSEDEAMAYVGDWTAYPQYWTDEDWEEVRAGWDEDPVPGYESFQAFKEDQTAPEGMVITHEEGRLLMRYQELIDQGEGDAWATLLIPRGAGFFRDGSLMYGELAGLGDGESIWEFRFDGNGRAISAEYLYDERVMVRMERTPEGG